MYLPIPSQHDCASAWREAVRSVDTQPGHEAYNVIIDIADPIANATRSDGRIATVDNFLREHAKSVETVANTIFPVGLYRQNGFPAFFDVFHDKVLPKVRFNGQWSGYYFERMTSGPLPGDPDGNPLWDIVERIRHPSVRALNKFELSLYDAARDATRAPYGGQCLSFLSFKVLSGPPRRIGLTAVYRNHYYIEKLLGNLLGLGRLIAFIAEQTDHAPGPLTVISTHAEIDRPRQIRRHHIRKLLSAFDEIKIPDSTEN